MTEVVSGPPITLPAVRVGAASALTAGLTITTIQPDWRVPQWELIALGVVLALAAAAAWSCTRAPATKLLTLWSVITLAAVVAWSVAATVGPPTDAPFTPAAVTALLLLAAGEAERRSCTVTDVPLWWPALALLAGITTFGGLARGRRRARRSGDRIVGPRRRRARGHSPVRTQRPAARATPCGAAQAHARRLDAGSRLAHRHPGARSARNPHDRRHARGVGAPDRARPRTQPAVVRRGTVAGSRGPS